MSVKRGIFITFEGSDGCGKSTQIQRLAKRLEQLGKSILITREPGGTSIGEAIRYILKDAHASKDMCSETELLLFAAARAQIVREVLLPALADGKVVLCDRFADSTTVYQGVARHIDSDTVKRMNEFAVGSLIPHLTILLDAPLEVGLQRIKNRPTSETQADRMEMESTEFYQAVRQGYLELAQKESQRFLVVDGSQDIDTVEKKIWEAVQQQFLI